MIDWSVLTPQMAIEFLLRWIHFLAGITWIGILYWFNGVNVNFQKSLDADLKPKVNPKLLLPSLFYFRWGAMLTVVSGFLYYVIILHAEVFSGAMKPLMAWLAIVGVTYVIIFSITKPEGALNNGNLLAVLVAVLVTVMGATIACVFQSMDVHNNASYMIGIGGGMGVIMLFNVWGIIWPAQKKILGVVPATEGMDKVKLARRTFLASRMNTWLSIPMLFFMAASSHLPLIAWY